MNELAYKEYVLSEAKNDRDRLLIQYNCYRPSFKLRLEEILDNYGLASCLQTATPTNKVRILELGCGEGLALQTVAEILETRGLRQAAEFYGLDSNKQSIITAESFALQSNPPRPYLHFFVHDVTVPLSQCLGLYLDVAQDAIKNEPQFDLIFATFVFEHLPNAQQHLERLYRESLKPGGLMFIRDVVLTEGEKGWILPHPAMRPFLEASTKYMQIANHGLDVSQVTGEWLRELGASQVQTTSSLLEVGGQSEIGLNMLRNLYLGVKNAGPFLISKGMVAEEHYNLTMKQLFNELGPQCQGHVGFTDNIAQKPA